MWDGWRGHAWVIPSMVGEDRRELLLVALHSLPWRRTSPGHGDGGGSEREAGRSERGGIRTHGCASCLRILMAAG